MREGFCWQDAGSTTSLRFCVFSTKPCTNADATSLVAGDEGAPEDSGRKAVKERAKKLQDLIAKVALSVPMKQTGQTAAAAGGVEGPYTPSRYRTRFALERGIENPLLRTPNPSPYREKPTPGRWVNAAKRHRSRVLTIRPIMSWPRGSLPAVGQVGYRAVWSFSCSEKTLGWGLADSCRYGTCLPATSCAGGWWWFVQGNITAIELLGSSARSQGGSKASAEDF